MQRCFQYIKDSKKKANHNSFDYLLPNHLVVSNTSKIVKRKQITTGMSSDVAEAELFPIHQR